MRNKFVTTIVALAALTAIPQMMRADAVYTWTPSANITTANYEVELMGCTVTLGNTTWTYGSSKLSPADMPMTDAISNSGGLTSFSDGDAIPQYGAVLKVVPTKTGVITFSGPDCKNESQKVFFVNAYDDNGTTRGTVIEQCAGSGASLHAYDVECGNTYYFFQLAKDAKTTSSYRYTLKGITFSVPFAYNMIERASTWSSRIAVGTYGELEITDAATWDATTLCYTAGGFKCATAGAGYLVVEGKSGGKNKGVSVKLNGSSSGQATGINDNTSNITVWTGRITSGQYATITGSSDCTLLGVSWVPDSSAIARLTESVTLDDKGFSTYMPFYSVTIPDGLKAYCFTALDVSGSSVTASEITTTIPANTAVLLKGTANTQYTFAAARGNVKAIGNHSLCETRNLLHPADTAISVPSGTDIYYGYAKGTGMFKRATAGLTIPQGKCYFKVNGGTAAAKLRNLFIDWGSDEATCISQPENRQPSEGSVVYNLCGQRVAAPAKGIYVVNGKKVMFK